MRFVFDTTTSRAARVALPVVLALSALLTAGCDEPINPSQNESDFTFQASSFDICPEPGGTGEATLVVIVFGPNGDVIPGRTVFFETTSGSLNKTEGKTSKKGRVVATVAIPRTPSLTVSADIKGAGRKSIEMAAPAATTIRGPQRDVAVATDDDEDGTIEIAKQVLLISPCHVQETRFRFTYDPAVVAFQELRNFDLVTSFLGDGGTATANDLGGVVEIILTRDAGAGGFTARGAQSIATDVIFHGVADGFAEFAISDVSMTDPMGSPYDVVIGLVAPIDVLF